MSNEGHVAEVSAAVRDESVRRLAGTNRRQRQEASHILASIARGDAELIAEVADALVDALALPEAQTRWECLDALTSVAAVHPELVLDAFAGAEDSLFDEGSAAARLSAFRFISRYGATTPARSLEAWPLMGEALQCYHGDPEYREMLVCLLDFARGDISDEVRTALAARMEFDAKNGRGFIKAYSSEICSAITAKE